MTMKEAEFSKLRFVEGSYRPFEYERWVKAITRTLTSMHPELGAYWQRILKSAEDVYHRYLADVSTTRVSLKPTETLSRTAVEDRIENKIRTMLMNAVPISVITSAIVERM